MNATTWADCESASPNQQRRTSYRHRDAEPMTPGGSVSVTILCADPVIAAGLSTVLQSGPSFQVAPAAELGDVVCGSVSADVIVADYDTALHLTEIAPTWAKRLIVFTNYDSEAKICRVLESGAGGYLLYGVGLHELFEGIRAVHQGGVALSPLAAARFTNRLRGRSLTPREKMVLEQMMFGLSNKVIARKLNLCVGTIKTHVKSILGKLDANSRTGAVIAAQHRGLLS